MSAPRLREILSSPRYRVLLALGFASGLPLYLVGTTLGVWMADEGVSLKTIGFFALAGTPYTLKFLWAPLMDRYTLPFLGRRRGWLLATQVLLALGLVGMALVNPREHTALMAAMALLVSFFSASQDIVSDAYRTDLLPPEERAFGVSVHTLGYRVGMVVAMSLALILSDVVGWRLTYFTMAACMGLGVVATLLAREPQAAAPPRTLVAAVVEPFRDYFRRGWPALALLAFILLFRVGDAVAFRMTSLFVKSLGFSNTELGTIQKLVGMVGSATGAVLGGLLVGRIGVRRGLLLFGAAQAATNLLYIALAARGHDPYFLGFAVGFDNFTGGLGSAAMVVLLTGLCSRNYSATQYALLSSLSAVPMQVLGATSGVLAETLGWTGFYVATALVMAPALLLLAMLPRDAGAPREEPPARPAPAPALS